MQDTEYALQFNLDKRQWRLYRAALELGMASAKDIAKKAGIQRTYFYDLSKKLLDMGLLKREVHGKRQVFVPLEPGALVAIQRERLEKIEQALPELRALYNTAGSKPKVLFYEGEDGIKAIFEEMVRARSGIDLFYSPKFLDWKWGNEILKKRIGRQIRLRAIAEASAQTMYIKKKDPDELREMRLLPRELYQSNIQICIYGNKVAIIDFAQYGLVLEDSNVAQTLSMVFNIVWSSGKVIL